MNQNTPIPTPECEAEKISEQIPSVKIVELSRKIRELSFSLDKEKSKSLQLVERLRVLETRRDKTSSAGDSCSPSPTDQVQLVSHLKTYQDKLGKSKELVRQLREKNASLLRELKIAQKVLEFETGESINLNQWSKKLQPTKMKEADVGPIASGWRGRYQQIVLLKDKVRMLETRLKQITLIRHFNSGDETKVLEDFTGASTLDPTKCFQTISSANNEQNAYGQTLTNAKENDKSTLRATRLEKENKIQKDKLAVLTTKVERMKIRESNTCLELSELKAKISRLLEKSRNDEDLIQTLLGAQTSSKDALRQSEEKFRDLHDELENTRKSFECEEARMKVEINQLVEIAKTKDDKIRQLEKQLLDLTSNREQKCHCTESSEKSPGSPSEASHTETRLSREISLLTTERNGLREMVVTLNRRLDRLTEEQYQMQRESTGSVKKTKSAIRKPLYPVSSKVELDSDVCIEDWLQQFIGQSNDNGSVEHVRSNTTNTKKSAKELQMAIKIAREEIILLKSMNRKIMTEKKEEFEAFIRLADELQHCQTR